MNVVETTYIWLLIEISFVSLTWNKHCNIWFFLDGRSAVQHIKLYKQNYKVESYIHENGTILFLQPSYSYINTLEQPYPCVSYEATKKVSRWERVYKRGTTPASCVTSTGMLAKNAATIPKSLVPNPH